MRAVVIGVVVVATCAVAAVWAVLTWLLVELDRTEKAAESLTCDDW